MHNAARLAKIVLNQNPDASSIPSKWSSVSIGQIA